MIAIIQHLEGKQMERERHTRKATFVLDDGLLEEAREVVKEGSYKSLNALVQEAVFQLVRTIRREKLRQSFLEASQDPLFLADLQEVERDFEFTDEEAFGDIR